MSDRLTYQAVQTIARLSQLLKAVKIFIMLIKLKISKEILSHAGVAPVEDGIFRNNRLEYFRKLCYNYYN